MVEPLATEGEAPIDGMADLDGALVRLRGDEGRRVLRAHPELGAGSSGYGPNPAEPFRLSIDPGGSVSLVRSSGGSPWEGRAKAVVVRTSRAPCCDAPACTLEREQTAVGVELELSGKDAPALVWVAASKAIAGSPNERPLVFANRLAAVLGVDPPASGVEGTEPEEGAPARAHPPAERLDRYAMRPEGDRVVLRDHQSVGPRETARRNRTIAIVLFVLAGALWYVAAQRIAGGFRGQAIAFASIAALLSLTAYAFFGVARFASRYVARSAPLVSIGQGRFVVSPWVSRTGAVDLRPEGRLGAAISIGELKGISVKPRSGRFAVEIDNDHGPIDALITDYEDVAAYYAAALSRAMEEARHPNAGASARQRARARARS